MSSTCSTLPVDNIGKSLHIRYAILYNYSVIPCNIYPYSVYIGQPTTMSRVHWIMPGACTHLRQGQCIATLYL